MSTVVTKIETESTEVGGLVATIEVERTGPNMVLLSTAPSANDLPADVIDAVREWISPRIEQVEEGQKCCAVRHMGGYQCGAPAIWRVRNDGTHVRLVCGLHLAGLCKALARDGASDIGLEFLGAT